jgi:hypothetical protein
MVKTLLWRYLMKKTLFFLLQLLLISITTFASIRAYEFEGLFYPVTMLRASDIAFEEAECVTIIDENTLEVKLWGKDTTDQVTFLCISDMIDENIKAELIRKNTEFLLNKTIYLSYDWKGSNEAGEILAYVWLPHNTSIGQFKLLWNEVLLLNGYAQMNDDVIQIERAVLFAESYKHARDNKLGVWKNINTEEPLDFSELPENIQAYLIMKYIDGFDTEDTVSSENGVKTLYKFDYPLSVVKPVTSNVESGSTERVRVGAICRDGTRSYATGSGACSHHGGVDYWLFSND